MRLFAVDHSETNPEMEHLIARVRQRLQFGQTLETIQREMGSESPALLFLAYHAALILERDNE